MGFRVRRSIKIAPGIKLNVGKRGITSLSVGRRGATMNFGKKGVKTTVGIPGTGVSYTTETTPYGSGSKNVTDARSYDSGDTPDGAFTAIVWIVVIIGAIAILSLLVR